MNKQFGKQKFVVANEEDGGNMWGIGFFPMAIAMEFAKRTKLPPLYNMIDFKRDHIRLLVPEEYWLSITQKILDRVLKRPEYFIELLKKTEIATKALFAFSEKTMRTNYTRLTNSQLAYVFDEHNRKVYTMLGWGLISTVVELQHSLFTNYAQEFLNNRVKKFEIKTSASELFNALSNVTYQSTQRKEYLNLLKLLSIVVKNPKLKKAVIYGNIPSLQLQAIFWTKVQNHVKIYNWTFYNYNGPAFDENRVVKELQILLSDKINPDIELVKEKKERLEIPKKLDRAEKLLKLTSYEKAIYRAFRATAITKLVRKDGLTYSFYALESALKEFAKRLKITITDARCLIPGEHGKILRDEQELPNIKARYDYSVIDYLSPQSKILTGNEAKKFVHKFYKENTITDVTELKGQPACLGMARGIVKLVNVSVDMQKMNKGDILVAVATSPEIVLAMKKSSAIVTDMGGITSHAAIISRELGIPCVIGTKIATKVFKDGDMVEVDANKGIITKFS